MNYYEMKNHLLIPCDPPTDDLTIKWELIKIGNEIVSKSNNIKPAMVRSKSNLKLQKISILSYGNL